MWEKVVSFGLFESLRLPCANRFVVGFILADGDGVRDVVTDGFDQGSQSELLLRCNDFLRLLLFFGRFFLFQQSSSFVVLLRLPF